MSDPADRAIAIVGLSAILPDAPDVQTFWENVKAGRYSISEVQPDRWDPAQYYDADPAALDKTYSKIGGWVRDWEWEPMKWRLPIPPKVADAMDEAQRWAVACARSALLDYGHPERDLDLERTAVVVGTAMAGDKHYMTSLPVFFPEFAQALAAAPSFQALPEDVRRAIETESRERLRERVPPITEDTMPGELANCMAGRIANLFDFHGPNFVCDAACASALAAIDAAADGLLEGEYDAALVGGVDRNMGPSPFVKFCKIGALSATGTRPYGEGADGFVMGEGAAFFLLKRLADAEAGGDRIYAVLRGVAGSSDGRGKGITAPNPAGQRIAVERAWAAAGLSPATAGLVEGHGTSTRVGDVVEVETLASVFGGLGLPPRSIALGSVKSNIGHLKGAAGAAGLLKTVMALHEKSLPPSLHAERPNPNIDFASTPFFVNGELKPWDPPPDGVRRAGVSAFGFGGTNYHAVLEEYVPGRLTRRKAGSEASSTTAAGGPMTIELKTPLRGALVVGAPSADGLRTEVERVVADARTGRAPAPAPPPESALRAPARIAIDYTDAADLASKGERALKAMSAEGAAEPAMWRALAAQGVFRGRGAAPKVAFLYTGQGSQYAGMLRELREREPVVADTFNEADGVMTRLLGHPLSETIFPDPGDERAVKQAEAELRRTEITQPAVLTVDTALTRLMAEYGLVPDMVMGHSLGEYGALVASGALPFPDALEAVSARGREMAFLEVGDKGRMAAVFAPLEEIEAAIAGIDGNVVVANINSDHQAVIGGASEATEAAVAILERAGHNCVWLPVSHAFHTSIVAPASAPLRATLERLRLAPPTIPLVANVDGGLYPMGPDAVPGMLDRLAAQVHSPVQFVKGLHTLYDQGARVFVELGPKKALHGFASDVLGDRDDVLALFTNHPKLGDEAAFNQALCGLYSAGLGLGRAAESRPVATSPPPAPARAVTPAGGDRFSELGHLFAEFMERGARLLQGGAGPRETAPPAVTGAALGLPGRKRVFDGRNVPSILDGEQEIDVIPTRFRQAMVEKHITRLVKAGEEGPHFEAIESSADVIKLAARAGTLDLEEEYGVPSDRIPALDVVTRLALAAGVEALRDAGIPLVRRYRTTTKGTQLPERWMLPESLRDDTGVVFAAAFPGFDSFAEQLTSYLEDKSRADRLDVLRHVRERAAGAANGDDVLRNELDHLIHELERERDEAGYEFDRRFLFRVLPMAHAQFAEYVGARGPNTHVNSACASTTQAFALAEDWIAAGRCRRVVILAADDVTTDHLLEWIGAGFLATGAAATDDVVEEAALPFDRRRHGMILGMGAVGVVVEHPDCAAERGLRPICDVWSTVTANSAFHGTRLDVAHIADVMERLVSQAEARFGIDRRELARELLFVSHETYTPARGGSASAEVEALRRVFGEQAQDIVVANTKGLTGHPMGVGIEDVVAIKALETGVVPPVPNHREVDPDLGPLNLSRGGAYPIRYALRLGAGFGSQISMSLLRWSPTPDGRRPEPDSLGYETRIADPAAWHRWLAEVSGDREPEIEVVRHTLRIRDRGPATRLVQSAAAPRPEPVATSQVTPSPTIPTTAAAPAPVAAPVAPAAPATAAAGSDEAAIRERVLAIVSEKTGYPAEMLDLDLDLEADLGIDTVKQAETFAAIREAWGIPRDESLRLRDYPTIAHAVRFVQERVPSEDGGEPSEPVAPSEAAAPAAAGSDEAAIRERVLAIVSEKTGYPAEMLDLDLDLEADLGIDTVKQAETFAAIREAWGIPRDESLRLRDYPTIAHAVRFVQERVPSEGGGEPSEPVAPSEAAAPAAAGSDEAAIRERVLAIVSEKTGYPAEMLDLDLDLEADLGIDTVKQAETFAAIREAWGIPRDESLRLRDYPTIAHAVRFVQERRPGDAASAGTASSPPSTEGVPPHPALRTLAGDAEATAAIPRRVPRAVLRPALSLCKPTGIELGKGARVAIAPDEGGVAEALSQRLGERGVEIVRLEGAATASEMADQVDRVLSDGPLHGVYWLPALDAEGDWAELDVARWRAGLQVRVKNLAAAMRVLHEGFDAPDRFLVAGTRLGGRHGYDDAELPAPMGGGVVGFVKAFHRERPGGLVKAVDFPADTEAEALAEALIEETLHDPGSVEIGHQDARRFGVSLIEENPEDVKTGAPGIRLGPETVAIVTGAAGSIVSAIVGDLAAAASGGTFHLLDLTPEPDLGDPDLARFGDDREGLKRTLFERLRESGERATPARIERELATIERSHAAAAALEAVRIAGGAAHYHQVDLTDAEAVAKVVEEIVSRHGRVDVLLHAAGLERSRLLPDKDDDEFALIFDVKCDGWFHCLRALGDAPLGATVAFSSIAGRFGNGGQTDYSAANDLLCKSTSQLRNARAGLRAVAIDWTAWGEIGMASRGSIPTVMAQAGIDMLPPRAGIPIVRRELTADGAGGEVVVADRLGALAAESDPEGGLAVQTAFEPVTSPMLGRVVAWGDRDGLRAVTRLDPGHQPFLDHHRIDGIAVLPGVMGLEAFAELCCWAAPGWQVAALEDVAFLAPFKLYRDQPRDIEISATLEPDGDEIVARCRLSGRRSLPGQEEAQVTEHFRARVRLAPSGSAADSTAAPGAPPARAVAGEDVYRVYFHGPAFQVLGNAWREGDRVVGRFAEGLPTACADGDASLVTRPRLLELVFQAAGVWEIGRSGRMGLPTRIDRVALCGEDAGETPGLHAVVTPRSDEGPFDAVVVDGHGRVRLKVEGYATAVLPVPIDEGLRAPLRESMAED